MRTCALLVGSGVLATAYWKGFRAWSNRWGVTAADVTRALPGDALVAEPAVQTTQGIVINALPSAIWPWLIQMGPGRGGAYTYDWIENLAGLNMHSADTIVPEWQHMQVGDSFPLGESGPQLEVAQLDPERALVLALPDGTWSWSFVLDPLPDGQTRLITRNRAPGARLRSRLQWEIMLPGAFLMMRKMLSGIKQRAEQMPPADEHARRPHR